jgi:hypothetical protein
VRARYGKTGRPELGLPVSETAFFKGRKRTACITLELLDHPQVPEAPDIVIKAAWITDGVAKLEPKGVWRL